MGHALHLAANKLGSGNSGSASIGAGQVAGQVLRAGGGAVFVRISGGARGGSMAGGSAWSIKARHGFLRVSGRVTGQVRTAESEWTGQGLGFAAFSPVPDQLGRLNADRPARQSRAEGVNPPSRAPIFLLPVANGRCRIPGKSGPARQTATNDLCPAMDPGPDGRKVPSTSSGSGVRAARCAGVNDRSACRPEYREFEGQGVKSARPCANGVNEGRRLGLAVAGVN